MRAFLLAALLAGCATAPAPLGEIPIPGLERVYRVAEGVYRSPQPSAAQFAYLQAALGIRTVVKLNEQWEGRDVVPAGVDVLERPMNPVGWASDEALDRWLVQVEDDIEEQPKPVLVHCTHGEDRTGVVVAAYRVAHGSMLFAARGEMLTYGSRDFAGFREVLERWAATMGKL